MSTPFRLLVPRPLAEAMVSQARAELPNECCGLLAGTIEESPAGRVGRVRRRYPLVNVLASPTAYESDPEGMFAAVRDMRGLGIDILAVYHSHPATAAVPSKTDLSRNYSPEVVNLIISLEGAEPAVRGWWLTADGFREAEWEIISPDLRAESQNS